MNAPEVLSPASPEEAAALVRDAEASGRPLIPSGLGNHLPPTRPWPEGAAVLSLARLSKVLRYEPGDFTIGVQAGIPLDVLRGVLAENRQEIPVDLSPAPRGTIGGALAQDRSGPRRARLGTFRNSLIGLSGLRGGGRIYRAGGMVVKNVAGYDIMKLLIGSRGLLGPILEANFKLRAIPAARSARRARFAAAAGAFGLARSIRERGLEPAALLVLNPSASAIVDGALGDPPRPAWTALCLFEGNAGAVRWLEAEAGRLLADARPEEEDAVLDRRCAELLARLAALGDAGDPGPGPDLVMKAIALPSHGRSAGEALDGALRPAAAGGGEGFVVSDVLSGVHLFGAGPGVSRERALKGVQEAAEAIGRLEGHLSVVRAPAALADRLPAGSPGPHPEIQEEVRRAFDPRGVFARRPRAGRVA